MNVESKGDTRYNESNTSEISTSDTIKKQVVEVTKKCENRVDVVQNITKVKESGTNNANKKQVQGITKAGGLETKDTEDQSSKISQQEIVRKLESMEAVLIKVIDTIATLNTDVAKQKSLEDIIKPSAKSKPATNKVDQEFHKNLEKAEKRCKDLQCNLEKSDKKCHELQKELGDRYIVQSRLECQISIMNDKVECSNKRVKHMATEMDTLQEVITTKNEVIADQEIRIKNLSFEVSKLQDQLIQEKIHASRIDDSLLMSECGAFSTPKSHMVSKLNNIKTPQLNDTQDRKNNQGILGFNRNNQGETNLRRVIKVKHMRKRDKQ